MPPPASALVLGMSLVLLATGCNKSGPPKDAETSAAPALAPVNYDLARLSADLKSTAPGRRDKAIEMAPVLDARGDDVIPVLLEALKDPTTGELGGSRLNVATSTREAAVQALLNLQDKGKKALAETGLKTLEAGLKDPKPTIREHTANAIGMAGPAATRSIPALAETCADPEPPVRTAAYSALERIKSVPPALILKLLSHADAAVAADAAEALSWVKPTGSDAIPPLLEALRREAREKDDPVAVSQVRNAAAEALAGVGKGAESAIPALVEMIVKARVEDVERMIRPAKATDTTSGLSGPVAALRRIGAPAIPAVAPLLMHDAAIVRFQAAAVLGGIGPAAAPALPEVQAALETERGLPTGQFYVFEELTTAALHLGGDAEKITAPVIALLSGEEEGVRYGACQLIVRIGRKATTAVPRLVELLNDPVPQVQLAAVEALGAIGPAAKDAVPALLKKMEGDDVDLARAATRTLRVFGPASAPAVPALAKALKSNDQNFCIEAAQALAAIGPEAAGAVPSMAQQLGDPRSPRDEKVATLQALGAIGPAAKDALPAVTKVLSEKDGALRAAAVATLGKIGSNSPDAIKKLTDLLKDSLYAVQHSALKALAGMGLSGAAASNEVKALLARTGDPAAKVWAAATLVAFGVEPDPHFKIVLDAIKDKSPSAKPARLAAIDVLGLLGAKAQPAVADLRDALKDKSVVSRADRSTVRERTARTLGLLGETARPAIPPLMDMLRDADPNARRAAAEALGQMGPAALVAVPKLRELARTDTALANIALDALDRIEPPKKME
jgi:HEAT repeat protein